VDKMPKFFVKATLDRIFCDAHIQKVLSIKNFVSLPQGMLTQQRLSRLVLQ
jgi:hypothetical protein